MRRFSARALRLAPSRFALLLFAEFGRRTFM